MKMSTTDIRDEVHKLAEQAFHHQLISGYGDSEYADKYQIVYEGKPRHLDLKQAHRFLSRLLRRSLVS